MRRTGLELGPELMVRRRFQKACLSRNCPADMDIPEESQMLSTLTHKFFTSRSAGVAVGARKRAFLGALWWYCSLVPAMRVDLAVYKLPTPACPVTLPESSIHWLFHTCLHQIGLAIDIDKRRRSTSHRRVFVRVKPSRLEKLDLRCCSAPK